jgi:hypothetical protein
MADVQQQLTFLAWVRPEVSGLITGQQQGRATASAAITLTESGASGAALRAESRTLPFLVAGPADVIGLQPGAIVRRYPAPGTLDHESDRCPYAELADPALPWRYTPAATPAGADLHPWLVLVVGEPDELTLAGSQVTIGIPAQQAHVIGHPTQAYRFAHVQQDAVGHRTTRILSGRPLQPGTDYLAVIVPAFDATGVPAWTGVAPVTVPAYDRWQFRTAVPAGSFEDLAARLTPGQAPATIGHAPLDYPRLDPPVALAEFGALVARTPDGSITPDPLPAAVASDLSHLRSLPAQDERGRPIVTLPQYGDAWPAAEPAATPGSGWTDELNGDPRHRGVAGLGLAVGIRRQEDLVGDVLDHLGALQESRQRIRNLAMGAGAARALWQRRTPSDPMQRLWLFGPALNRLVTADGPVGGLATAAGRTVARGTFSAAARRVVRAGPARTSRTAHPPGELLASANRQPPAVPSVTAGLPVDDAGLKALDAGRRNAVQLGRVDGTRLAAAVTELAGRTGPETRSAADHLVAGLTQAAGAGRPIPWGEVLSTLAGADPDLLARRAGPSKAATDVVKVLGSLTTKMKGPAGHGGATADDLLSLLPQLGPLQPGDPVEQPLALDALASGVNAAFDPTTVTAPAIVRVLATISGGVDGGIDPEQPLAPPEPCLGLGRPAWADLAAEYPEWLLPGAGDLGANTVVALESNAAFIDAYLAGLNTQLLGELRWRNIPVATGCTPIRRFWDRADTTTGEPRDDVAGIASWPADGELGDATHRAPGTTERELVIAVRGDLFLRYPATMVYLRSAVHPPSTAADFGQDPADAAPHVLPGFRGRLRDDIVFFGFPDVDVIELPHYWLVFEEPPAGYQFRNDSGSGPGEGHTWAAQMLAPPVRVLIRGDHLDPGGHA